MIYNVDLALADAGNKQLADNEYAQA